MSYNYSMVINIIRKDEAMATVKINLHNEKVSKASQVARRHYTVGALMAELANYPKDAEIVAQDMLTGEYQALDFRGIETVREEEV